ncbi:MAG TPA: YiiX family permuted papain-like enzyme [Polyangiaceae bacterium]
MRVYRRAALSLLGACLLLLGSCERKDERGARPAGASPVLLSATLDSGDASPLRADGAFHEGDVILQTSRSAQSRAIQLATHSRYSHVGLLHADHGRFSVYEAVGPVRLTPVESWIARGEGGHFVVLRLKDADKRLTPETLQRMQDVGRRFGGKPYDFAFGWSDDRIYCSELVWKIYREGAGVELGALQRIGEFDLTSPVVQRALHQRYGDRVPLDEPVISPGAIAESPLLEKVIEN